MRNAREPVYHIDLSDYLSIQDYLEKGEGCITLDLAKANARIALNVLRETSVSDEQQ